MLDLGLRSGETVQLRLADVDWTRRCLTVSGLKRGRGRELPLPAKLFAALRAYVDRGRPAGGSDRLFLRHRFREGEPLDSHLVRMAMGRAYRRAGLATSWAGTHRLRHTFAIRLLAKGASFKQLADLLGHRAQESTVIYTHADLRGLRQVAQPWPC
jgi:site-specific recombinase XerD